MIDREQVLADIAELLGPLPHGYTITFDYSSGALIIKHDRADLGFAISEHSLETGAYRAHLKEGFATLQSACENKFRTPSVFQ